MSSVSDRALMPPPPTTSTSTALTTSSGASSNLPKRIKRPSTVLDEDQYTDALGHIIARDFFPGLLETRAEQTYLDAVESGDLQWITEAEKDLYEVRDGTATSRRRDERQRDRKRDRRFDSTPRSVRGGNIKSAGGHQTPMSWRGSTPGSVFSSALGDFEYGDDVEAERARKRKPIRTDLSLTAFQTKYTSEDNESFNALLDKQAEKKAAKYAWLTTGGNKIPSKRQLAYRERQTLLLKEKEEQDNQHDALPNSSDANVSSTDTLKALTLHHTRDNKADPRPAMPDIRPPPPRNAFMFPADSVEDTHETVAQAAEAASRAGPKTVVYPNTRMPPPATKPGVRSTGGPPPPPSPTLSAVRDAIAGNPRFTDSEAGSAYVGEGGSTALGDEDDDIDAPRVNGYAFVDAEPAPGEIERLRQQREQEQLSKRDLLAPLTHHQAHKDGDGGVSGSGSSSNPLSTNGPSPFTIRQSSRRETLHHALVARTAAKKRAAAGGSIAAGESSAGGAGGGSSVRSFYNVPGTGAGRTPTPRFASGPVVGRGGGGGYSGGNRSGSNMAAAGNLTPAGQKLLQQIGTPRSGARARI